MSFTNWHVTKLRAFAEIDVPLSGTVKIDISDVQSTFELNTIPTLTLRTGLGREVYSGLFANIHGIVNELKLLVPIRVWLLAEERADSGTTPPLFPDQAIPFFIGFVCYTSFSRSRSNAAFQIECVHWLSNLDFSSAVSRSTTPNTPTDFSYSALYRLLNPGAGFVDNNFYSATEPGTYFNSRALLIDFWSLSLVNWLTALCLTDRLVIGNVNLNNNRNLNIEALSALSLFEGGGLPYKYGVPLTLNAGNLVTLGVLSAGIADVMRQPVRDAIASVTMWSLLVNKICAEFGLAICPMIDRALIVPFTPGLRTSWQTIFPTEYDYIQIDADSPRPLRGVAIASDFETYTGLSGRTRGNIIGKPVGGYYENPGDATAHGLVEFYAAPPWLKQATGRSSFTFYSSSPYGIKGAAASPGTGYSVPFNPAQLQLGAQGTWDDYARHLYLRHVLRERQAVIRCNFRLDIAPGSTVQIVTSQEKFVGAQLDALGLPDDLVLFADVRRVTTVLSSESRTAHTLYHLQDVRSSLENTSDSTSTATHPLWSQTWSGAPLVDYSDGLVP